jgi:uncharacterized SAM-binding protein YcdF (DUF218 family)
VIVRAFSFAALAYALGFVAFLLTLGTPLDDRRTDGIVVPTGGAGRIDRGLELIEAKRADRMLVTGVDPSVRPVELALQYRVPPRLFDCCIDLGQEAVDTRSNGDETAAWVRANRYRTVRLVTSDWHMARARLELANALGDAVEIVGDPVRTNAPFSTLFAEYNKLLIRRVALWIGYTR